MPKVTLQAPTGALIQELTFAQATRLLHLGVARIVKFYPLALQLKANNQDNPPLATEFVFPYSPSNSPSLTQAKATKMNILIEECKVSHEKAIIF